MEIPLKDREYFYEIVSMLCKIIIFLILKIY